MTTNQAAIDKILTDKKTTTEEALVVFDSLPAASLEFMKGRWSGFEIETGHPMDGLLTPSGWYGKLFLSNEDVHPLMFFGSDQKELYSVNPKFIPTSFQIPKTELLGTLLGMARVVLETNESKARLRNVEYRGRVSATMVYDEKPVNDIFVKIDDNRVMGAMDLKGQPLPYFFVLERDDDSEYEISIFKEADDKFKELFEMEIQNRAFALRGAQGMADSASREGDKIFLSAWVEWERFLRDKYAPYAHKYGFSQEPQTMAKLQAGFGRLAHGVLPTDMIDRFMLDETIAYTEKLRDLERVAPQEDQAFFSFVVKQEEEQIEALRLRIADKNQEAADLLRKFMADSADM
ncbi:MAG: DUF4334 domain-containing protein [Myxococcota bacterium]